LLDLLCTARPFNRGDASSAVIATATDDVDSVATPVSTNSVATPVSTNSVATPVSTNSVATPVSTNSVAYMVRRFSYGILSLVYVI
jgi:hypothetical protein